MIEFYDCAINGASCKALQNIVFANEINVLYTMLYVVLDNVIICCYSRYI